MTGNEMITSLGYRLEDTGHVNFALAQKLVALNDAQRQAVSMLSNDALVHLQTSRSMGGATSDTSLGNLTFFSLPIGGIFTGVICTALSGLFTISSHGLVTGDTVTLKDFEVAGGDTLFDLINNLTSQVTVINANQFLVDGITAADITSDLDSGTVEKKEKSMTRVVSVYDDTNDRFVELTTIAAIGDNTAYNYGTKGALFNNRLYVSSSTATTDCTLVYITSPSDIVASDVEITYLSDSIQQLIVELAESLLWRQDNRQNRATAAANNAAAMIQTINASGV